MKRFFRHWRHWLLLVAVLAALAGYIAFTLEREYRSIGALETERLGAQSKVVEDNLRRQLAAINLMVERIVAELPRWQQRADGRNEGLQHLKSLSTGMSSVRTFAVVDARGTITLSNREELIGRNFAQRDYFQAPLRSLNPKTLYVSAPFKTVLGVYTITLTRAVLDGKGNFAGVVSAILDPLDMQILLNSVRYADDMQVMLVHGDGKVFVMESESSAVLGKDLSQPGSVLSQHLKSGHPLSHFQETADGTRNQRLAVLRTLQPATPAMDKPLVIGISRQSQAVFVQWRRDLQNQTLTYLGLVLLSSTGLAFYRRQSARQRASHNRLRLATEATGVGIWEFEVATRRYHFDPMMFELFGLNPQAGNSRNDDWHQLLLPGELERIKDGTRAVIRSGEPFELTFQLRRPDGGLRYMHNRAVLQSHQLGGVPTRLVGTTQDLTERKLLEADLRVAATAFDCQESIVVTDANQIILRVNRAFTALFGYTSREAVGATPRILKSGRLEPAFYAAMWADIQRDGAWHGEIWNRCKSGVVLPVSLSITAVCDDEGRVTNYVATHTDITLRKVAEEEIKQLAFHDPLTHLPNRRLLDDRLRQALIQAKRDQKRLALMFIDLDKFKPVNDDFGHQVGDELLQAVARRLQTCVRESDTVARIGGDEFVVLLPSFEMPRDAMAVAEKIHQTLLLPFTLSQGPTIGISSCVGVALYPEHGRDANELTKHADAAMYQAKAAGRDRVMLFQTTD